MRVWVNGGCRETRGRFGVLVAVETGKCAVVEESGGEARDKDCMWQQPSQDPAGRKQTSSPAAPDVPAVALDLVRQVLQLPVKLSDEHDGRRDLGAARGGGGGVMGQEREAADGRQQGRQPGAARRRMHLGSQDGWRLAMEDIGYIFCVRLCILERFQTRGTKEKRILKPRRGQRLPKNASVLGRWPPIEFVAQ
jgi:hypothetical protein